jgi:hypothetical protein
MPGKNRDMRRTVLFHLLFLLSTARLFSAGEVHTAGARSISLGSCSVALSDPWSGFNNPAGLSWQRQMAAGIYYENRFLVKELGLKAAGFVLPIKGGTFGISFQHSGFSLYNEILAGLAFGRSFGKCFSMGARLDYLRIHAGEGYGTRNLVSFGIGFQLRPIQKLTAGIYFANPVPIRIVKNTREYLPVVIRLGLAWEPVPKLLLCIEAEKEISRKPSLKAGIEYQVARPLSLRIGVMTHPTQFTFGFGFVFGKFRFDLSSSYHLYLGYSPQASLIFSFR